MRPPHLLVTAPSTFAAERAYIYETILSDFLGFDITVFHDEQLFTTIKVLGDPAKKALHLPDALFQASEQDWSSLGVHPTQPLAKWDLSTLANPPTTVDPELPVVFGHPTAPSGYLELAERQARLGLDVFGSAFYLLTRYEEVAKTSRHPIYNWFPAAASLAFQEGFLTRPIVDEYVEILWLAMEHLWPGLERPGRLYRTLLSHDVDRPLWFNRQSVPRILASLGADLIRRKNPRLALRRLISILDARRGHAEKDIFNTFDLIMNLSERHGLRSAFYFITHKKHPVYDGSHTVEHPEVRKIMRNVHERGHEIGLHPSYDSFLDGQQIQSEFELLRRVAIEEGIDQEVWGGRQHYLRWEAPTTWRHWQDAGLDYDATVGFGDHHGFRCGVCREFTPFDVKNRRPLKLRERPLVVMDATLLAEEFFGMSTDETLGAVQTLSDRCRMFRGDFSLLWHNSELADTKVLRLYQDMLKTIA